MEWFTFHEQYISSMSWAKTRDAQYFPYTVRRTVGSFLIIIETVYDKTFVPSHTNYICMFMGQILVPTWKWRWRGCSGPSKWWRRGRGVVWAGAMVGWGEECPRSKSTAAPTSATSTATTATEPTKEWGLQIKEWQIYFFFFNFAFGNFHLFLYLILLIFIFMLNTIELIVQMWV